MISFVVIAISKITFVYLIYELIMSLMGIYDKKDEEEVEERKSFALLVAAHNEEKVISDIIKSLKLIEYPKEKYDIFVVADNCDDNTAKIAREDGAIVYERHDLKNQGKGYAMEWMFKKIFNMDKQYDTIAIFDADNLVHKDFLKHMNDCLNSGYKVAEGYRDSKNPKDNWISGSYTIFYLFQNIFFNRSRMSFDASGSINGTGFMVSKDIIDRDGFETYTLTEDVEFTGQCALKGERIAFVEDAITYDEYPIDFGASWKQRKRWSAGIIQCMNIYSFKLFKKYLKTKNLACLDMSLVYLGPLMQVISFINLVMLVIFKIVGIELHDIFSYFFATNIVFFAVVLAMGIAIEIFALLYKKKDLKGMTASIILFSIFVLSWIPINISVFVKKYNKWEAIKHTRSIKIDDIKK